MDIIGRHVSELSGYAPAVPTIFGAAAATAPRLIPMVSL
jgi:hypothetical protein